MEDGLDDHKANFNDIFSLKKPKDAKAGLASGLKSVGKGIVGGAVGLIAAPIVGASQEGFTGFAKGLATGVAGAVILPVTGVSVGAVQVVRGLVNQPSALSEAHRGHVWDQDQRCWVQSPGTALQRYDDAAAARRRMPGGGRLRAAGGAVDYYELLQVPRDATSEQIKKSYYLLARKLHPDKNADNPRAKELFQQLGEAYQVLGDAELRRRYDAHGAEGLDVTFMDGADFYNMLFGSELFEYLIGELALATAASAGADLTAHQMRVIQTARVDRLVVNLNAILRRWVEGDEEGFRVAQRAEAERLVRASFGDTLLHAIGKVYEVHADIALGGLLDGAWARMKQSKESLRLHLNVANAAIRVYQHQQRMEAYDKELEWRKQSEKAAAARIAADTAAARQRKQQQLEHQLERQRRQGGAAGVATTTASSSVSTSERLTTDFDEIGLLSHPGGASAVAAAFDSSAAAFQQQAHIPFPGPAGPAAPAGTAAPAWASASGADPARGSTSRSGIGRQHTTTGTAAAAATAAAVDLDSDTEFAGPSSSSSGTLSYEELQRQHELESTSMSLVMEAMVQANVLDIQTTLGKVCRRVLQDRVAGRDVCRKRAMALRETGHIFQAAVGPAPSAAQRDAKSQMEDAFMRMMEKRMAAEEAAAVAAQDAAYSYSSGL